MKKVAVITPTIATDYLVQAMESVGMQAEHWIIVDGLPYAQSTASRIEAHRFNQRIMVVPENTGTPLKGFNGLPYTGFFNGYRINAAIPMLINADYIMFLDEDNWFDPDHIPSMVKLMEEKNLDWCYSLRKIVDIDGNFLFNDDCDSLGEFPSWKHGHKFVDMNCYLFKNCVISQISHVLFDLVRTYDGDKNLFKEASNRFPNFAGTGKYTVNYRMTRPNQEAWYREGNEVIRKQYSLNFPWSNND